MSECTQEVRDFDALLVRLFDEPPAFADSEAFVASVIQRLDRRWQVRSLVIGVTGLLGGFVAVSQIMANNLVGKVEVLSVGAKPHLLSQLIQSVETHLVLPSLPFGGEGLWMSAGLAGLALVFALTRAIEEY
ncbi:MAG: hypothetical protein RJA87_1048 [Pseudomonadota bacterium]|jgi:hypothetical protein